MYRYLDEKGQHLHTFGGKPLYGTSTVVGVISKPLTWWASGMAVAQLGWTNPKEVATAVRIETAGKRRAEIVTMSDAEYETLLQDAYKAHNAKLKTSAKTGTDMHAELEYYVNLCLMHNGTPQPTSSEHDAVQRFAQWAQHNVQEFLWSEKHCYSETMWTGGIIDAGAILKDGKRAIIDFKSSKDAYFSQFIQVGGYAQQVEENGLFLADGTRIMQPMEIHALIVFPFGGGNPRIVYDVDGYESAFVSAATLYKLNNEYDNHKPQVC